ncbi:TPA: type 1 fimbrial protein [Citrobacter amalonaticus]|uniref:Type 1 fimbrial protein n=1 Tax=Citrobacter amalonaticus TaxID=35703 RepID=A0A9C7QMG5_CITAM|nr:type 1 fimbrial protein [Citrobacter amalonaticus]
MMKNKKMIATCSLIGFFYINAYAHDGTVNISGVIQENTCEVANDSTNKFVDMGTLSVKQFSEKGVRSQEKQFSINLVDCGPAASVATVTFSGVPSAQDKNLYSVDHEADAGSGIALGIYDSKGNLLPPDKPSEGIPLQGGEDSVELKFSASYQSVVDDVTSGSANVSVTFVVNYA